MMINTMNEFFSNKMIQIILFFCLFFILFGLYKFLINRLKKYALKTKNPIDDFLIDLFKFPALWLLFWICVKIFSHIFLYKLEFFNVITHANTILLILSVGWILLKTTRAISYYLQNKLDIENPDNLKARTSLTQIKVFQGIVDAIIVIIFISVSLLTFDKAKTIGLSILTSAGIAGIIIGLAAQKTIAMILAGMQIAITQPIRLDDVVIVENEWGRIEEITLTYVVVKIWDERRLVLPVNYFLENSFQNWTRTNSNILGTIFLHLDYSIPLEKIREELSNLVKNNKNWDNRVANIQVTNSTEKYMEVRILVSSSDSSKNWDLRVALREQMINYINQNYPECFAKIRINKTEKDIKA